MGAKIFLEDIEEIGHVIKKIRQSKNLTQDEVAQLAGIDKKHLRGIEKGKYSVGMSLFLLICEALEVNRFEILTIAWRNDYDTFVEQWQISAGNTRMKPNNEGGGIANNSKSLRNVTKKEEKNLSKRLLGGDKRAIIKVTSSNSINNFAIFKLGWWRWKKNLNCWDVGLSS